jgi:5-methylcytosine-specific restriction endonuclease McrA
MAWARANPDKVAASLERTKPQRYAAIKRYQEQNPDKIREWKRRAAKMGRSTEVFTSVEIFDRDDWLCQLCGEPVDPATSWPDLSSASLDHRMPLSKGGHHTRINVQLAHLGCNMSKNDRII